MYLTSVCVVHQIIKIVGFSTVGIYAEECTVRIRSRRSTGCLNLLRLVPCLHVALAGSIITTGMADPLCRLTVRDKDDKSGVAVRTIDHIQRFIKCSFPVCTGIVGDFFGISSTGPADFLIILRSYHIRLFGCPILSCIGTLIKGNQGSLDILALVHIGCTWIIIVLIPIQGMHKVIEHSFRRVRTTNVLAITLAVIYCIIIRIPPLTVSASAVDRTGISLRYLCPVHIGIQLEYMISIIV